MKQLLAGFDGSARAERFRNPAISGCHYHRKQLDDCLHQEKEREAFAEG